jgi:predicted outer membrane repeat protein
MHTITVTDSTFTSNQVTGTTGTGDNYLGGAIFSAFSLSVTGGRFSGNSARDDGGAIDFEPKANTAASMSLSNITFDQANTAARGGAVRSYFNNSSGTVSVTVTGCLFNGNVANGPSDQQSISHGGGLYIGQTTSGTANGSVSVTNSTFYNNSATTYGGGIYISAHKTGTGTNTATLTSLTITKNMGKKAGGGVYFLIDGAARPVVGNSIIAQNQNDPTNYETLSPDVFLSSGVQVNSAGFNLIGARTTDNDGWVADDLTGTIASPKDPGLDSTGPTDNGGPTFTIKLATGSAAYRAGNPLLANNSKDQRGYNRGANVSIGAYDPDATQP